LIPSRERIVLVSGLPGSGKTTLARELAPLLGLPLIDKDDILERLFEAKGIGDAEWRRRLSRESDALLQAEACHAAESTGAVLASFWRLPGMPPDSGTPTDWLADLSEFVVTVRCLCPPEIAAERFTGRTRHAGHRDGTRTVAEVLASIRVLPPITTFSLGEVVDVDTSGPVAADAVAREIRRAFTRFQQIRLALPSERSALEALQTRASLANPGDRDALLANPDAIVLPLEQIEAGHVFVLEAEGAIKGFAAVLPREDGNAELDALFVEPDTWRSGYGRALVDHGAAMARDRGAAALYVIGNPHAEDFYGACGFETIDTTTTRFGVGLLMRRVL
jgi:GNAT superfamily N-acetyltransferase